MKTTKMTMINNVMSKITIALALIVALIVLGRLAATATPTTTTDVITNSSDYCEGFKDGYPQGWKEVKGYYSVPPATPVCPVPREDCLNGYRCGFNRGFAQGVRDAQNANFNNND